MPDAVKMLADDIDRFVGQKMMNIGDPSVQRILDRDQAKIDLVILNRREGVFECRRGDRLGGAQHLLHRLLETRRQALPHLRSDAPSAVAKNGTVLVPPVYIAPDAEVEQALVGPYVSVGAGAVVRNCIVAFRFS